MTDREISCWEIKNKKFSSIKLMADFDNNRTEYSRLIIKGAFVIILDEKLHKLDKMYDIIITHCFLGKTENIIPCGLTFTQLKQRIFEDGYIKKNLDYKDNALNTFRDCCYSALSNHIAKNGEIKESDEIIFETPMQFNARITDNRDCGKASWNEVIIPNTPEAFSTTTKFKIIGLIAN